MGYGINNVALTGSMTGEVSENLKITIPSLNIENSTFWAIFEYHGLKNDTPLWELKEYGINH